MTETQAKKILVIDDEVHIRRVLEVKLKNRGYQVITAKNGQQGLDFIYSHKPDAVVTDINMPLLEGDKLCQLIDKLKEKRPFLTLVITARISPEDRAWVQKMRDTQLMEKPFSPSRLVQCIDAYFKRQSS